MRNFLDFVLFLERQKKCAVCICSAVKKKDTVDGRCSKNIEQG